jgi:tetratricopeptide (TPR) repeat protein
MKPASASTRGAAKGRTLALALLALAGAALVWFVAGTIRTATSGPATPAPATAANPAEGVPAGDRLDGILNAARDLLRTGEHAKADAVLAAAIEQYPREQVLLLARAELLAGAKRAEEAYALYARALEVGPREGEIEFAAGTVASMAGKHEAAAEHYRAAQVKMPRDHRPPLYLAQVQVRLRQTDAAKANLVLAGTINPEVAVTWGTLADLELAAGDSALALQHVRRARDLEPRVTLWRVIEARALKRDGRPEEAIQVLQGVDPAERFEPAVLTLMGECLGLLRRPGEAAAIYVAAAEHDAGNPRLALEAALWLERAGERARAAEWAQRAKLLGAQGADAALARLASESDASK